MQTKNKIIVFFLLLLASGLTAQEQKKGLYIGTGLTRSFYQDLEYSSYTSQNSGINFRLGFRNQKEASRWDAGLELRGLIGGAFEQGWTQYSIYPTIQAGYMRKIKPMSSSNLWLGGRLDLLDINVFINDALNNNAGYYFWSSNLHLATEWQKHINEKWDFHAGASLVLFGFTKELTSYAFSAPEEIIKGGKFHYQKEDDAQPLNFKFFKPRTLGEYNRIITEVGFTKNKSSRFSYSWEFTRFKQTKDRPLTFGNHNFKWTLFFGKNKSEIKK